MNAAHTRCTCNMRAMYDASDTQCVLGSHLINFEKLKLKLRRVVYIFKEQRQRVRLRTVHTATVEPRHIPAHGAIAPRCDLWPDG